MTEVEAIARVERPATVDSLTADLAVLEVEEGSVLLVHSSLRALGWVCGGAAAVVLALERALGARGTLVMPTHSGDLSDPTGWENPPVPADWWATIRHVMPAYDPDLTPTRGMGAIPECFRSFSRQVGSDRRGRVAAAEAVLVSQRALVDHAVGWLRTHRVSVTDGAEKG